MRMSKRLMHEVMSPCFRNGQGPSDDYLCNLRHTGKWFGRNLSLLFLDTCQKPQVGRGRNVLVVQRSLGILEGFEDGARIGERFPLKDTEGVVDVDRVPHAVEDAGDVRSARKSPQGFSGKGFFVFVFRQ